MALALLILSLAGLAACLVWAVAPAWVGRHWMALADAVNRTPTRRHVPSYRSDLRDEIDAYLRRREGLA